MCSKCDGHPKLNNLRNWREPIRPVKEHESLQFDKEKDVHMNFTDHEEKWLRSRFGFASNLVLIVWFIS